MVQGPESGSHERRKLERHKVNDTISVVDFNNQAALGTLVDLHTEGFMLIGSLVQETGRIYSLRFELPRHINGCSDVILSAECLWLAPAMSDDNSLRWAGFQIQPGSIRSLLTIEDILGEFSQD